VLIHSHNKKLNQISDITIEESEIQENLKVNIASTLSNYPNIGINSFGSVTSKPALRGFSGDRFLLTNNGNESGDLSQSSIDHVITLDMSEVRKIEIIRGPKALTFGPNAIGGVVNTTLIGNPSVKADRIYQRYLLGSESFNNAFYGNLMLYIPFKNNQINFFSSNKKTENETSSIGELENTKSQISNYKYRLTNYNNFGFVSYSFEDYNMFYGIPPAAGVGHANGVDILLNKKTNQFSFHRDINFGPFDLIDINYSFIEYLHLEDSSFDNDNIVDIFDNGSGNFHVGLSKNTRDLKIELASSNVKFGLEFDKKLFKAYKLYFTPDTKEFLSSFYGFSQKEYNDFNFFAAFRLGHLNVDPKMDDIQYNNIDTIGIGKKTFNTSSFSFGFTKKINEYEFNSWIMQTMRAPRVEELFSDGPHLGSYAYEIGNPNLKEEKIFGVENSISYKLHPMSFSLITFYNESPYYYQMSKMGDCPEALTWDPYAIPQTPHPCAGAEFIEWGSSSAGYLIKYNSIGSDVNIGGLEIDFSYEFEKFKVDYNFSLVRGYNNSLDLPLSYMNPDKHILSFGYEFRNTHYKVRFSKMEPQDRLGEFETYTPGAFLTDLVLRFQLKKHNIIVQCNNIFDEEYYNHLSRIKDIYAEPGRNINIIYKLAI
jgi:iron complex outermembrane receptor protein